MRFVDRTNVVIISWTYWEDNWRSVYGRQLYCPISQRKTVH